MWWGEDEETNGRRRARLLAAAYRISVRRAGEIVAAVDRLLREDAQWARVRQPAEVCDRCKRVQATRPRLVRERRPHGLTLVWLCDECQRRNGVDRCKQIDEDESEESEDPS